MRRLCVFVIGVLVSGCAGAAPPVTDVSALRVVDELAQPTALTARLSPGGNTLLYNDGAGPCVRGVDGTGQRCVDEDVHLDTQSAAWSPDGTRLAFTDTHTLGLEPDLWVYDVGNGELTNLTDDGVPPGAIGGGPKVYEDADMDVYPSWSPDGARIRFLRRTDAEHLAVMSISPGGADPRQEASVATPWARLRAVAWSAERFAWFAGSRDGESGSVYTVGLAGDEPRRLIDGAYPILSFSADGQYLLVDERGLPADGRARVVRVVGGNAVPVASGSVTYPTWAPRGQSLAYVAAPGTLRVVARPGGEPKDLYKAAELGAADNDNLDWAPGVLLVADGEGNPTVLTLDG